MFRHIVLRRGWWLLVAVLFACGATWAAVAAAGRVTPSATTLTFRGLLTEPQQRSLQLAVDGGPITNVQVVRHDLIDAATGAVILADGIVVAPMQIDEVQANADFAVTLSGAKREGHYVGTLDLRYVDQGISQTLPITLDANLTAVPSVDTTTDSKNLTWYMQLGQSTSQAIFLTQNANGIAEVQEASILVMRNGKNKSLPEGTVRVEATLPLTVAMSTARPITVTVNGQPPAGQYNGTLLIKVVNQPAALQVPITIKVKDEWWWAVVTLIVGLGASALFGWWNSEGKKKYDATREINRVLDAAQTGGRLQADQLDSILNKVEAATRGLNSGETATAIQALLDEARKGITDGRAATESFIKKVQAEIDEVKKIQVAKQLRQRLDGRLIRMTQTAEDGRFKSLTTAEADLAEAAQSAKFLQVVQTLTESVTDVQQQQTLRLALDTAQKIEDVYDAMRVAGKYDDLMRQAPRGATFAARTPAQAMIEARRAAMQVKGGLRWALGLGAFAIGASVYLFALAVGYVTLYVSNDTFGAEAQHYLTLFLWAAVVETVRGKTITVTELQTAFSPKLGGSQSGAAAPDPKPAGGG